MKPRKRTRSLFAFLFVLFLHVENAYADPSESKGVYIDISMDDTYDLEGNIEESVEQSHSALDLESSSGAEFCEEDSDCARGYRCSTATQECTKIPDCIPSSGREHGQRHGSCILCSSDSECGWLRGAGADFCWPDGACRTSPPFKIVSTLVGSNVNTSSSNSARQGDRICLTVVPTFVEDLFRVDIIQLDMCASTLYFQGAKSSVAPGVDKSLNKKGADNEITYPGISPYDPDSPGTTGCRTDPEYVRVHSVFSKTRKGHETKKGGETFVRTSVDGTHHFHTSVLSSVTAGDDTVCFDARAITAPDVPVYIQAKVKVSASHGGQEDISKEEEEGVYRVYGLRRHSTWEGTVVSPSKPSPEISTIRLSNGLAPVLSSKMGETGPVTTEDSMFVSCQVGTTFDGVAGLCESPNVSKDLFFWMLIVSVVVLIMGSVLFVVRLKAHNEYMQRMIHSGVVVHMV